MKNVIIIATLLGMATLACAQENTVQDKQSQKVFCSIFESNNKKVFNSGNEASMGTAEIELPELESGASQIVKIQPQAPHFNIPGLPIPKDEFKSKFKYEIRLLGTVDGTSLSEASISLGKFKSTSWIPEDAQHNTQNKDLSVRTEITGKAGKSFYQMDCSIVLK